MTIPRRLRVIAYAKRTEAKDVSKIDVEMMERGELSLDGFWIRPHSYVTYLDELFIVTKFKNNSDQLIEINTVTCSFETEESLLACSSSTSPMTL